MATPKKAPGEKKKPGRKPKATTQATGSQEAAPVSLETTPERNPAEDLIQTANNNPELAEKAAKAEIKSEFTNDAAPYVKGPGKVKQPIILEPIAKNQLAMFLEGNHEKTLNALAEKIELLKAQKTVALLEKELTEIEAPKKLTIAEAIIEVRKNTGIVKKAGENTYSKYKYAMASDVIESVREAVNDAGIVIFPCKTPVEENYTGNNSLVLNFTQWFKLVGPDGSFIKVPVRTAGHDTLDKAPFKANTGALKYLLINVFLLPTGDDPEANNPAEQKTGNQGQPRNNQPGPKTPAATNETPAANTNAPEVIKYAKTEQKQEITRLLNNEVITRQEKTKMLLNLDKLDVDRANQTIEKIRKIIAEREEQKNAATPEPGTQADPAPAAPAETKQENPNKKPVTPELLAKIISRIAKGDYTPEFRGQLAANYSFTPEQNKKVKEALDLYKKKMEPGTPPAMEGTFEQPGQPAPTQPPGKTPLTPEELNTVLGFMNAGDNSAAMQILSKRTTTAAQKAVIDGTNNKLKAAREAAAKAANQPPVLPFELPTEPGPEATPEQKQELIQVLNSAREFGLITREQKAESLKVIALLTEPTAAAAINKLKADINLKLDQDAQ